MFVDEKGRDTLYSAEAIVSLSVSVLEACGARSMPGVRLWYKRRTARAWGRRRSANENGCDSTPCSCGMVLLRARGARMRERLAANE